MVADGEDGFDDPQAELETALIDEYLRKSGTDLEHVRELPRAQAAALTREATAYATARLSEVESRARFVHGIHGAMPPGRTRSSR